MASQTTHALAMQRLDEAIGQVCSVPEACARDPGRDFTRSRKLPLPELVRLMVTWVGDTIPVELNSFVNPLQATATLNLMASARTSTFESLRMGNGQNRLAVVADGNEHAVIPKIVCHLDVEEGALSKRLPTGRRVGPIVWNDDPHTLERLIDSLWRGRLFAPE